MIDADLIRAEAGHHTARAQDSRWSRSRFRADEAGHTRSSPGCPWNSGRRTNGTHYHLDGARALQKDDDAL